MKNTSLLLESGDPGGEVGTARGEIKVPGRWGTQAINTENKGGRKQNQVNER